MPGIGGEIVPEAVEIDLFAPFHEPFHVRPAEAEMPQQRALDDLLPRTDAWNRSVDQHHLADALGMFLGEGESHHIADVMGDDVGTIDLEPVKDSRDVLRLVHLGEAAGWVGRPPEPAQVGNNDRMIAHQLRGHRRPHVAGLTVTVKQDDRGPRSAHADVDHRAVGADLLRAECARIGRDLRRCRNRTKRERNSGRSREYPAHDNLP